jgi:tetratricopeptide (TPR) repeat protein/transglutaminase-like putative cysteine protease
MTSARRLWSFAEVLLVAGGLPFPRILGAQDDYSRQPVVIERFHRSGVFEADGTSRVRLDVRVRVQSAAALEWFGQLTLPYGSANQRLDIEMVRVLKAGGTTVTAPPEAVQDVSGPIAREAPMFSDLRQKIVTVPGLEPGDTLEYRVVWTTHTPFAPGQFWDRVEFTRSAIVLDDRLTYSVPRRTRVHVKTDGLPEPVVADVGERRTYEWRRANLVVDTMGPARSRSMPPSRVQLTTFRTWADVGAWYGGLTRGRDSVTPEIRRRAAELVAGRSSLADSITALYDYVSSGIRYVSLSFGLGRYQPHAAAEVLANQYGDCKDKHVLLAALLKAIGVPAAPVLISMGESVDGDVPSPLQFDHLISFVRVGADSIWLDATPGVAPFGFLLYPLRGKQALVIPAEGASHLARTPAAPPFPTFGRLEVAGTLTDAGRLTYSARHSLRGDAEVVFREIFRRLPHDNWTHLLAEFAAQQGMSGTVGNVNVSDPAATADPLAFSFQVDRSGALTWTNRRAELQLPLPEAELPDSAERSALGTDSLRIGVLDEQALRAAVALPAGVTVRLPVPVTVTRDYATYRSIYQRRGDTLVVERVLRIGARVLPLERLGDFEAFRRAVRDDHGQRVAMSRTTDAPAITATAEGTAGADDLHAAAMRELESGNASAAARLFGRVIALVPRHQWAWNNLGRAYLGMNRLDSAAAAFRKQIEVNPYDEYAHNNLGLALRRMGRPQEALAAFRQQIEVNPLDRHAHANLGRLYLDLRRDSSAVRALEQAASLAPDDTSLHVDLGRAYLRVKRDADAIAEFERAAELSDAPWILNNAAYALAERRVHLHRAEVWARQAVDATAAVLRTAALDRPGPRELMALASLGSYWDTLGWILFGQGKLVEAETYVRAAWLLNPRGEIGDHLAQILERRGRKEEAARTYALALHAIQPLDRTRDRLIDLVGSKAEAHRLEEVARVEFGSSRTIRLGRRLLADVTGEVQIVFGPGSRVESVRVVSGPARLAELAAAIRSATYPVLIPDSTNVRLVRSGVVTCSLPTGECALVLLPAAVTRVRAVPQLERP